MGAAAFLMAEMVGVQYGTIAVKAILPAFLYFAGIFMMVHLCDRVCRLNEELRNAGGLEGPSR